MNLGELLTGENATSRVETILKDIESEYPAQFTFFDQSEDGKLIMNMVISSAILIYDQFSWHEVKRIVESLNGWLEKNKG